MKLMLANPASGAFLDPGEGKTSITLGTFSVLKQQGLVNSMLVVATKKILDHEVWPKEIKKWGFDLTHVNLHGKHKLNDLKKKVDVYIINYEGLAWLHEHKRYLKADMLVLDESSKVKSSKSKRFKLIKAMLPKFKRRHLLTGTPSPNSLMDLFSQIYVLDEGERLGRFITHYRNKYFHGTGYGGYTYVLNPGADKQIYKAIDPIIYRPGKDHLNIPKEKYNDIYLDLGSKVMKQYKELEKEFIIELEKGIITAVNAAAKTQKLRQFANGHVYDEDRNVHFIHEEKLDAAEAYVEELQGNPCLIGYEFQHDRTALESRFPEATFIGSGVKKVDSLKAEKLWNAGKIPVLIGQISSIAHGLNLQESGHNMLMFSHLYKFEDVEQFIRRLRRQGQKKRVIVTRLIAKNTVDEDIIFINQHRKRKTQNSLLEAMRKRGVK